MKQTRLLTLLFTALIWMSGQNFQAAGQEVQSRDDVLPVDPNVRIGRLENGLTYYVRQNGRPEDRAELRLVVNAGSILEDEDQLGLAHFAEHMAFNGTKKFERHELVDYIESIGMRFGPELNAYTSFDETVYMLQVPTDSLDQLLTGFDILREWATNVTYDDAEIDKERGVVIEEWRQGRGALARMQDEQFPILFKGSRYAERLPIGDVETLRNFPYDAIKRFYRDWYRPDLMAVVAVGDFDPDEIEGHIRDIFSDIEPVENPRPREVYDVPGHAETLVTTATDPEAPYSTVSVLYKHPARPFETVGHYRERLVDLLYNSMFNARLGELTQSTDPPFIQGFSGTGSLSRTGEYYSLTALVREGEHLRALETLLTEAERVRRFGFTASELERTKNELVRAMEKAYIERDKTESGAYVSEYVENFLTSEPIPGIEFEYERTKELVPTITLDEVNRAASQWITEENRVIQADGPEKPGSEMPDDEAFLSVFEKVESSEITPFEDRVSDEPLLAAVPEPGEIVDEIYDDTLGVTRLTLSNGVKVVMKPTDFKNDEILFSANSPGGTSLVSDEVYTSARYASVLVGQSGLGKFGPIELEKKLSGKIVRISPYIGTYSEGFSGSSSHEDIETLLQLTHLYFTAPRADSVAFESYRQRLADFISSSQFNPENAFRDTLVVTLTQGHERRRPVTPETIKEINLDTAYEVFRDRFADASDFTFYLVGRFDVEEMKPLIRTYLGSLPSLQRGETWRDDGVRLPKGVIEKEVFRGMEPKSRVEIVFSGPFEWSLENRQHLSALVDMLRIKLREVMREDMGGTYGVGVNASRSRIPTESYSINISFGTDPERVEEMVQTVFTQIDSLQTYGTTEKYLTKVREADLRQHQENLKENSFWINSLAFYDEHGEDPKTTIKGSQAFLRRLTPEMIRADANKYLDRSNYVKVVLYPEGEKTETR